MCFLLYVNHRHWWSFQVNFIWVCWYLSRPLPFSTLPDEVLDFAWLCLYCSMSLCSLSCVIYYLQYNYWRQSISQDFYCECFSFNDVEYETNDLPQVMKYTKVSAIPSFKPVSLNGISSWPSNCLVYSAQHARTWRSLCYWSELRGSSFNRYIVNRLN